MTNPQTPTIKVLTGNQCIDFDEEFFEWHAMAIEDGSASIQIFFPDGTIVEANTSEWGGVGVFRPRVETEETEARS